jgi:hypothetical protein
VVGNILIALVKATRSELRGNDDEEYWLKFLKEFTGSFISNIPILVGDIYSYFVDGWELTNPVLDTFNDFGDAISGLEKAVFKGSGSYTIAGRLRKLVYALGKVTGIPVQNINNIIETSLRNTFPELWYAYRFMWMKKSSSELYGILADELQKDKSSILDNAVKDLRALGTTKARVKSSMKSRGLDENDIKRAMSYFKE